MFDRFRSPVLRVLRIPHDPIPPAGAVGSVRVFRAARNFYKFRLLRWTLGQLGALAGIVFSVVMLDRLETGVNSSRAASQPPPAAETASSSPDQPPPPASRRQRATQHVADRWPDWIFPLLKLAELGGIALYLVQIPVTYAMARLDYELRWYIVTDRSLRVRSGLATVRESTMSFANIQQVVVTQGPIQRLLGLADVRVRSAGGGGRSDGHDDDKDAHLSLHTVVFHGVSNGPEIRDLILERLRLFRETGLGDPDERHSSTPAASADTLAAARELLAEARALRHSIAG